MKSEKQLVELRDRIFQISENYGHFPFNDWEVDSKSFYSMVHFWNSIFSFSAGNYRKSYVEFGEVSMFKPSDGQAHRAFQVISYEEKKIVYITPDFENMGTFFLGKSGVSHLYSKEFFYLEIICDLDRDRILSAMKVIESFCRNQQLSNETLYNFDIELGQKFGGPFGI